MVNNIAEDMNTVETTVKELWGFVAPTDQFAPLCAGTLVMLAENKIFCI